MIEFKPFPKIARLNRDILITEKLDGTNAAVVVGEDGFVGAQSRNKLIEAEAGADNYGFARWVQQNMDTLRLLGPGHHFGEWWGHGIQRGYGLTEKRFSLFNVLRWSQPGQAEILAEVQRALPNVGLVPELYRGPRLLPTTHYDQVDAPSFWLANLRSNGSVAAPGFMEPEGIVVLHMASKGLYKVTLEGDESYKGAQR